MARRALIKRIASPGWQPPTGNILKSAGSGGRYGALAIRFSDSAERNMQNEYFTSETFFNARGGEGAAPVLFNHGHPISQGRIFEKFANTVFPDARIERTDAGLFASLQLDPADPLQSALAELINRGSLRWSSGSTSHMVKRGYDGQILRWPIAEVSLTPTPAEPRLPRLRKL
jgi:hypothetical protein